MRVLTIRSAVNAQQQWNLRTGDVADGLCQQIVYFRSVLALEADFFCFAYVQLRHEFIILMRDLTQPAIVENVNFVVLFVSAGDSDGTLTGPIPVGKDDWRAHQF